MKKLFVILSFTGLLLVGSKANAGFVDGSFSATPGMGNAYIIDCSGSGHCGLIWQSGTGRWHFLASDGSEWILMSDKDPSEDLGNGVKVEAVPDEGQDVDN